MLLTYSPSTQEKVAANANSHLAWDMTIACGAVGKDLTKLTRDHTTAFNRIIRTENQISLLETQLGITERWTADSADYVHITDFVKNHNYLRAINSLEALVVQQLFELTKMNHSGMGTGTFAHSFVCC